MRCFFKDKKRYNKNGEKPPLPFLENGGALLEALISFSHGRHYHPIRCFTAKELVAATNDFAGKMVFADSLYDGYICKGRLEERLIMVVRYRDEDIIGSRGIKEAIRDIVISSQMSHLKNVLKLAGCCLEFKAPALIYEYVVEFQLLGNVLKKCRVNGERLFPWRNRIKTATGIANAILYLHSAFHTPVIYRDLKPSKVMIDENGVAKLMNFSLSISLPPGESKVEDDVLGTWGFIDPEYCSSGVITQKTDVYSFGVLLLVLVTGQEARCKNSEGHNIAIVDYIKDNFEKNQISEIVDPRILEDGFDQKLQLEAVLNLALRCTRERGEDRPEMIDVAKELRRIDKQYTDQTSI